MTSSICCDLEELERVNARRPDGGFGYWVSDEQLQAYSQLTPLQRLRWLDEALRFILLARSEEARERHDRLRRGLTITGD
jgi:hypothetical protein